MISHKTTEAQVKIGVFADAQYCDCEMTINRYYRNSPEKLAECISTFNKIDEIDFIVGLGDLIDKDFESFEKINAVLDSSEKEVFQVTGNHDLLVEKEYIDKVPEKLGLDSTYYTFSKEGWRFIFLDGNELTFQSNDPEILSQAKQMLEHLRAENKPNAHDWNGGMSTKQIQWLEKQLSNADKKGQKVILFCHYPLLPIEAHTLWNAEEILPILFNHKCLKACINGHNHAGNYALKNGIHFITMRGMVDTETENAWSVITLSNDQIKIEGFGREVSRNLEVYDHH